MSWISPTGHNDPSSDWADEANAYDDDIETEAISTGSGWSGFLELEISGGVLCNKVRFYAEVQYAPRDVDIDAYYDDGSGWGADWHDVYQGSFTALAWVEKSFPLQTVTKARIRFNNTISGQRLLYKFDFWKAEPSAPGYGNCVGLWRMNDNTANKTVKDSSREGNDGQAERNTEDLHATGKIDGALDFNGSSDFITVGYDPNLDFGTGDFSISLWFYPDVAQNGWGFDLIDKRSGNDGWAFAYLGQSGNTMGVIWFKILATSRTGSIIIDYQSWHHLVAVRSSGVTTIYIGASADTNTLSQAGDVSNGSDVRMGKRLNQYFNGRIDAVILFNRALSAEEIAYLWNGGNGVEDLAIGRPLVGGSLAAGRRGLAG